MADQLQVDIERLQDDADGLRGDFDDLMGRMKKVHEEMFEIAMEAPEGSKMRLIAEKMTLQRGLKEAVSNIQALLRSEKVSASDRETDRKAAEEWLEECKRVLGSMGIDL